MALIRFADAGVEQIPTLSASKHNGRIGINKALAKLLGVQVGDFVAFYQNDEDPREWWVRKESDGLQVKDNTEGSIFVKSPAVASHLLNLSNELIATIKMLVSAKTNEQGMFLIVTSSINKQALKPKQKNG